MTRLLALVLTLAVAASCAAPPPTRETSLNEYYYDEYSGGVQGKLLGPEGIPSNFQIWTPW